MQRLIRKYNFVVIYYILKQEKNFSASNDTILH